MADLLKQYTDQIIKLQKEYDRLVKSHDSLAKSLKANKLSGGKDLQNLNKSTTELNSNFKKLAEIEKERIRLINKLNIANSDRAQKNAELSVQLTNQRRINKEIARDSLGLTTLYQKESKRLNELRKRYKDVALEKGRNSKEARKLAKETLKLDGRLKRIDKSVGQFQRNIGNYTKGFASLTRVLSAAGVTVGLVGMFRTLRNGFNIIRNFQKENAILAGVLNTTRSNIKGLTDEAIRLGSITAKTAQEITSLEIEYARLGFTQSEILDLTKDTIDGSIALNAELSETAKMTGVMVKSFDELKTTDADKILDTLTLSTQKSAINFEYLSTALPKVAGAANAANFPFEVMLDHLGQAADRGIEASIAATSLRNIYIKLAEKGLTLNQALSQINNSQDKLNEATRIFDKRASVTALALAANANNATKFNMALDEVGGTAKRVAEEQLDTLDGSITLATSAWEGMVLSFEKGEGRIAKSLRGIIDGFAILFKELSKYAKGSAVVNKELREQQAKVNYDLLKETEDFIRDKIAIEKESLIFFRDAYEEGTLKQQEWIKNNFDLSLSESEIYQQAIKRINTNIEVIQNDADRRRLSAIKKQISAYTKEITDLERDGSEVFKRVATDFEITGKKNNDVVKLGVERYLQLKENVKALNQEFKDITTTEEELNKELGSEGGETGTVGLIQELTNKLSELNKEKLEALSVEEIQRINWELQKTQVALEGIKRGILPEDVGEPIDLIPIKRELDQEEKQKIVEGVLKTRDELTEIINGKITEIETADPAGEEGNMFLAILGFKSEEEMSEEERKVKDQFNNLLQQTKNFFNQVAQARIRAAEQERQAAESNISSIENEIAEQEALGTEAASRRVQVLENQLAEEERARDVAIQQQEKAQKQQQLIDDAQQLSSIGVAIANLIKNWSTIPFIGQAFAAASIAVMLGAFAASKQQAASSIKAEDGLGFTAGGERHSQGGFNLGFIEAEKGEPVHIYSRKSASKYGADKLNRLHSILNSGDMPVGQLDMLMSGIGSGVIVQQQQSDRTADIAGKILDRMPSNVIRNDDGSVYYPDAMFKTKSI